MTFQPIENTAHNIENQILQTQHALSSTVLDMLKQAGSLQPDKDTADKTMLNAGFASADSLLSNATHKDAEKAGVLMSELNDSAKSDPTLNWLHKYFPSDRYHGEEGANKAAYKFVQAATIDMANDPHSMIREMEKIYKAMGVEVPAGADHAKYVDEALRDLSNPKYAKDNFQVADILKDLQAKYPDLSAADLLAIYKAIENQKRVSGVVVPTNPNLPTDPSFGKPIGDISTSIPGLQPTPPQFQPPPPQPAPAPRR